VFGRQDEALPRERQNAGGWGERSRSRRGGRAPSSSPPLIDAFSPFFPFTSFPAALAVVRMQMRNRERTCEDDDDGGDQLKWGSLALVLVLVLSGRFRVRRTWLRSPRAGRGGGGPSSRRRCTRSRWGKKWMWWDALQKVPLVESEGEKTRQKSSPPTFPFSSDVRREKKRFQTKAKKRRSVISFPTNPFFFPL